MDWMAELNSEVTQVRAKFLDATGAHDTDVLPGVNVAPLTENCWLDDQGRLRIKGIPPKGIDRLDLLLQLGASTEEIKHHIHPLGTPYQWERWEAMKNRRAA